MLRSVSDRTRRPVVGCPSSGRRALSRQNILKFEFDDVLDPKTRELCALAAAAAGGCSH